MRMWMLPASIHCDIHLRGAHVETHMLLGSLRMGKRFGKLLTKRYIDPYLVDLYHDEVAAEMTRRGMNHQSPLDLDECDIWALMGNAEIEIDIEIDTEKSERDLRARCPECAERMSAAKVKQEVLFA